MVCDVSNTELWLRQPDVKDYDECIKSCQDEADCRSISFYTTHPTGKKGCSHWSTMCKNLKYSKGVTSKNLKGEALNKRQCDVSRAEKWISKTGRGGTKSLADCRNRCMNHGTCNSFTYYNHGDCSFFSTCCEATTIVDNAHTERWRLPF